MPAEPLPLVDALPEDTRYRDTGCSIAPSCLNCPLPRCRYDEPAGLTTIRRVARDARVVPLRKGGMTVREIARRTGLSLRTVQRVLRRNGM